MANFIYRNQNYRDELIKYSYPFDENSVLENDEIYIGTDLFLDAVLFFKTAVELPVYISDIDGTAGESNEFSVMLSDANRNLVARALIKPDEESIPVCNNDGVLCGLFVMHQEGVRRFNGSVAGKLFHVLQEVATFGLDVCHVSRTEHLRYISVNDQAVYGDVQIVARHGVRFSINDGVVSLDVVSDYPSAAGQPITHINGVSNRSIWLAHHPQLNMRIAAIDGKLQFVHVRDTV